LKRGSRRDVIVTRNALRGDEEDALSLLPSGARVGTSSARRLSQLASSRPDIVCAPCRGNVETRLELLASGVFDAVALAEAGLERLGSRAENVYPLPFVTSAGQGAIAAETLEGSGIEEILKLFNHIPTWYEVTAERAFLSLASAGCSYPVAVNAAYVGGEMRIDAEIYPAEIGIAPGKSSIKGRVDSAGDADALSSALWDEMRASPAARSLAEGGASL
jgi:hydroxymethylbilane synthase